MRISKFLNIKERNVCCWKNELGIPLSSADKSKGCGDYE